MVVLMVMCARRNSVFRRAGRVPQIGAVTVSGAKKGQARHIRDDVRLRPGQPVDARKLSDDLDWLNRNPFRRVEAVFSPGDALGATNLDLRVTQTKPWQVYAGYANSGSSGTGYDRYLLGGQVADLIVPDSLVSYQFTASPDFFDDHGRAFAAVRHPAYVSHGLRGSAPVAPRQEIEASFDHVETNEASYPFKVRQITDEASLGYRTALSNFSPLPGDLAVGVEAKQERRQTFFQGTDVLDGAVDVYQVYVSWAYAWTDPSGKTLINVTAHDSPGGLTSLNAGRALAIFTNGRVTQGQYQYLNAQLSRTTRLPGRWTVSNVLIAQYANHALPDTEQIGVGGADLVRGYTLDDGAYDNAVVSRNEIRAPLISIPIRLSRLQSQLSPFAFVDAGYGSGSAAHKDIRTASTGVGADVQFGPAVSVNLTGADAIIRGVQTKAGDWRFETGATVSF
jgi:hemolysin activation/secretion protein